MKKMIVFLLLTLAQTTIAQWEKKYGVDGAINALIIKENNIFAGTWGGIYMSTDNGDTWTKKNNGLSDTTYINTLISSGNNIFTGASWDWGGIFLSTNNGDSWIRKNYDLSTSVINTFSISGNNIFAGSFNGVFLSTDNGENWIQKNKGFTTSLEVNTLLINGNYIFAGLKEGVFISSDNGDNWVEKNKGLNNSWVLSFASSGNKIYAGTYNGVFLSTDYGDNWIPKNNGFTSSLEVHSLLINGNYIFAGTYNGVFISSDNGDSWIPKNKGAYLSIFSLLIIDNYIFAGTAGLGLRRAKLSDMTNVEETLPLDDFQFTISPNPASDYISISVGKGASSLVVSRSIVIYNSLGVEMKSSKVSDTFKVPETSTINISTEDFPPGIYFCSLNIGMNKITKSFVVMR